MMPCWSRRESARETSASEVEAEFDAVALASQLVAHLAEVPRRDLALKRGYPSIRVYARKELGLSDRQAWERVSAARLALQMPETVERLARGELTLCAASALWSTIREAERPAAEPAVPLPLAIPLPVPAAVPPKPSLHEKRELLGRVLGKTGHESAAVLQTWKRERAGTALAARPRPPASRKAIGTWTELGFSLSDAELALWDRLRDLLSHKLGTRDSRAVLEWLIQLGLEKVDPLRQEGRRKKREERKAKVPAEKAISKQRTRIDGSQAPSQEVDSVRLRNTGAPSRETTSSFQLLVPALKRLRRKQPAAVKRRIWIRYQGRCQHTDPKTGRKCESSAFVDFDHRIALSQGGSDDESNLILACSSHNRRRPRWSTADQPTYAQPTYALLPSEPLLPRP